MQLENQKFAIDNNASRMTWEDQSENKVDIALPVRDGYISLNKEEIIGGSFFIGTDQMVDNDQESSQRERSRLEKYLKPNRFFEAQDHPEGKFTILEIQKLEGNLKTLEPQEREGLVESPTHRLTADLTLGGETFPVHIPARVEKGGTALSMESKFKIDRSRWGISYSDEGKSAPTDNPSKELVTVGFHIEAGETAP